MYMAAKEDGHGNPFTIILGNGQNVNIKTNTKYDVTVDKRDVINGITPDPNSVRLELKNIKFGKSFINIDGTQERLVNIPQAATLNVPGEVKTQHITSTLYIEPDTAAPGTFINTLDENRNGFIYEIISITESPTESPGFLGDGFVVTGGRKSRTKKRRTKKRKRKRKRKTRRKRKTKKRTRRRRRR